MATIIPARSYVLAWALASMSVQSVYGAGHESSPPTESATAGGRDEIVVTARKRSESLQDVPLSVQALSAEEIQRANIVDLADLTNFTPGVALFENIDRGYGQVFIRGMQNTPPVGDTTRELASIFIDGIYYTGGVSAVNLDNVERVEVIKGPQSALFGRSTFSGAINFISKTPANEFGANVSVTAATDEEYVVGGSVEGPLIDDLLAGRISARYREFGGQYTNSLNGDPLGEEQDEFVTGQLYFTPLDWLSAKLTGTYQKQEDGPPSSVLTGKGPVQNFTSASGATFVNGRVPLEGPIAQNRFPSNNANIRSVDAPAFTFPQFDGTPGSGRLDFRRNGLDREFKFLSLDVTAELAGGYTLSYLGGYSDEEARRLWDFELSAEDNYYGWRATDSESSSHELRLTSPGEDRLRWLAGVSYLQQELFERDPGAIFGVGVLGGLGLPVGAVAVAAGPRVIVDREIENTAVFGSLAYDVTDRLTLSAEARYQIDDLTDTVDRATGQTLSGDTKTFLPRVIAEFDYNDDVMFYAVVAKGVRPTTINSQFAGRTPEQQAIIRAEFPELDVQILVPEEEIWSYEVGAKSTLFDGRMVLNANAYYSDWSDYQDIQSLLADIDGDGLPDPTLATVSGTDIDIYGIELETSYAFTDNWYAGLTAAWNVSELTGAAGDSQQQRFLLQDRPNGERLPQTPEYAATAITQYTAALKNTGFDWFLRGEAVYVGSRYASTLNLAETGSSFDVNTRLGIENERYTVVVFAENLFDNDTFESLRSNADCATTSACSGRAYEAVLARQRQIGLTLQARF